MRSVQTSPSASESAFPEQGRGALPALGFATTVAMWTAGYFCRLPVVQAPSWLLLAAMLLCLFGGGVLAGRLTGGGAVKGAWTGLIASLLNLLILGSVLGSSAGSGLSPSAAIWIPGSLILGGVIGALGGLAGARRPPPTEPRWTGLFAFVGVIATFLLIVAGGIVTSSDSGLAVVDWPNSFGYSMFLYPLSQMSGGIYYEHAHRLIGSLVGLTTLVLAIQIWRLEGKRKGLKFYALLAILFVIIQGILGGLRVTGQPTLSTSPQDMSPSLTLAVVHGIMGQLFLGIMVSIAIMTSRKWVDSSAPVPFQSVSTDRKLNIFLCVVVIGQLALGAVVRHLSWGLMAHITFAVVVLTFAVLAGLRSSGLYSTVPTIRKMGSAIVGIACTQVLLGLVALMATGVTPDPGPPSTANITLTTLHQAFGAFLLAHVVMLICWLYRLVTPGQSQA